MQDSYRILGLISIDVFMSIFASVIIFALGFYLTNRREKIKKRKKLFLLEDYILTQLFKGVKSLEMYFKEYDKFLSIVKDEKSRIYLTQGFDIVYIKNISQKDKDLIFEVFTTNRIGNDEEKTNNYCRLDFFIDKILKLSKKFETLFNEFLNKSNEYNNLWNDGIEKIRKIVEQGITITLNAKIIQEKDIFIEELDIIYTQFQKEKTDIFNFPDINNKFSKFCNSHRADPRVIYISDAIIQCAIARDSMLSMRKYYISRFEKIKEDLEDSYNNVKESLEYYNKLKRINNKFFGIL